MENKQADIKKSSDNRNTRSTGIGQTLMSRPVKARKVIFF
jgi:hypothetical protein